MPTCPATGRSCCPLGGRGTGTTRGDFACVLVGAMVGTKGVGIVFALAALGVAASSNFLLAANFTAIANKSCGDTSHLLRLVCGGDALSLGPVEVPVASLLN